MERGRAVELGALAGRTAAVGKAKPMRDTRCGHQEERGQNRRRGEPSNSLPGHRQPNGLDLF